MKKKLIIFDFADTIAKLEPSKELLLQRFIYEEIDLKVSIDKISELYHYVTNTLFYSSVQIQELSSKKDFYLLFNQKLLSLLGVSHQLDANKLFEYFKIHGQHWTLKEGVKSMLERLKSQGYILSLVSNFDTRLYEILEMMQIDNLFDSIFISQEVGLEKPNPAFVNLVLQKHHISPENTIFVGDNYDLDFLPALKNRITPILLDESQRYSLIDKRYKINNILEVEGILV